MSFNVRQAKASDIEELQRLWKERSEVYIKDPRIKMTAEIWCQAILSWLPREDVRVLVADRNEQLIGYIIGWTRENLPGLTPAYYGLVSELSVDGHCKQGGVGTALLAELKVWFKSKNLTTVEIRVPHLQAIEQAFWRANGASDYYDHMWYRLE
ncbi:MAG: GNAT family N-acetyltransferase [Anaerolineae bacterium]|nr:GNAT family N-acetyltransferase [Anaerolineae bacterium]